MMDSLFDFRMRQNTHTVRAGKQCSRLFTEKGDITDAEYRAALEIDPLQSISVHLPYSQTYL
ncbi:hypothetical protein AB4M30_10825 [Escherichia coli]|uniref:hypothetical protein n=1 Tax=Escherichia coli TaxID=562 RepID=UPI003D90F14B